MTAFCSTCPMQLGLKPFPRVLKNFCKLISALLHSFLSVSKHLADIMDFFIGQGKDRLGKLLADRNQGVEIRDMSQIIGSKTGTLEYLINGRSRCNTPYLFQRRHQFIVYGLTNGINPILE